jgi:hypothetical protein
MRPAFLDDVSTAESRETESIRVCVVTSGDNMHSYMLEDDLDDDDDDDVDEDDDEENDEDEDDDEDDDVETWQVCPPERFR